MVFRPNEYRNKDGIGMPSDDKATDATSAWTAVALLKGIWNLLNTGITTTVPTGAATAALQTTGNTTLTTIDGHVDGIETLLTAIDGHVDGLETLIGTTNSTLTTIDGRVDGLETLITATNTALALEFASAATVTALASAATSAQLLAANSSRKGLMLNNTDANAVLVKYGTTASATSFTVRITQNGYWEMPKPIYTGRIDAIWEADGSGSLYATEL